MSYERKEILTFREHQGSPQILVGFVLLIFLVFYVVFFCFVSIRPVSCVPNVASFSGLSILDCLFGFSNVYNIIRFRKKSLQIPKG